MVIGWPSRIVVGVCLVVVYVVLGFVMPRTAQAATYVESCPSPSAYTAEAAVVAAQSCAVQSERLEAVVTALEANGAASGTVSLSDGDRKSLDLIWIGVFLSAGFAFGGMVGGFMAREAQAWGGGA